MHNTRPQSEVYREAAMRWADLDAAARMLEEGKSAVLSQRMARLGDMPVSKAELTVKASDEWADYIKKMVRAKTEANKARIEMDFVKMQYWEQTSQAATERQEMRMTA
jgi:predicted hydrolase (HD superfamily)